MEQGHFGWVVCVHGEVGSRLHEREVQRDSDNICSHHTFHAFLSMFLNMILTCSRQPFLFCFHFQHHSLSLFFLQDLGNGSRLH